MIELQKCYFENCDDMKQMNHFMGMVLSSFGDGVLGQSIIINVDGFSRLDGQLFGLESQLSSPSGKGCENRVVTSVLG